jgi:arabinose-5-phosphate isomerase
MSSNNSTSNGRRERILDRARRTLRIEADAVESLIDRQGESFVEAVDALLETEGRLVVTGMGKSGAVGRKLAATFASTGTSSFFLHPAEGVHGDLGMVCEDDIVLAISYSGYTDEIQSILVPLERIGPKIISLTGDPESILGQSSDIVLNTAVDQEAGPMDLAPTASTTATQALGDALAMSVLEERDFAKEDFARFHPQGSLGKKLLLQVSDLMHEGEEMPLVTPDVSMKEALFEMTQKRLGITGILDDDGRLIGCITDGDLRRILEDRRDEFFASDLQAVMTEDPLTIEGDKRAVEALNIMEDYQITALFIVDDDNRPEGVVHMHDILREGIDADDLPTDQ